jgi:hypothetical protein
MSRYRHLIITLGVVAMLLLTFGTAAARGNDTPKPPHGRASQPPAGKGKPAHLYWTPRRITQAVTAGQIVQLSATFSSSADIAEATLVIQWWPRQGAESGHRQAHQYQSRHTHYDHVYRDDAGE